MEINGVSRIAPAAFEPAAIPVETAAGNREAIQAVKAVNASELLGEQNQLMFQQDPRTRRVVVKLVKRDTGEVVMQIPTEQVLRLAEDLKKLCR